MAKGNRVDFTVVNCKHNIKPVFCQKVDPEEVELHVHFERRPEQIKVTREEEVLQAPQKVSRILL